LKSKYLFVHPANGSRFTFCCGGIRISVKEAYIKGRNDVHGGRR
jgi:hypothetical protein